MKKFLKTFPIALFFICAGIFSFNEFALAGLIDPTFNMTVKNILRHPGSNGQDSIITFELYIQQTNQGLPGDDKENDGS